jgi:hypothetical protein
MLSASTFTQEILPLWITPRGRGCLIGHLAPLIGVLVFGDSPLLAFYLLLGELLLATWSSLGAFCWRFVRVWEEVSPTGLWGIGNFLGLFVALGALFGALILGPSLMAFAPVLALQPDQISLALRWDNPLWLALIPAFFKQFNQGLARAHAWRDLEAPALVRDWQQDINPLLLRAGLIATFGVYCWLFAGFGIYLALLFIAHVLAWADTHPERVRRALDRSNA